MRVKSSLFVFLCIKQCAAYPFVARVNLMGRGSFVKSRTYGSDSAKKQARKNCNSNRNCIRGDVFGFFGLHLIVLNGQKTAMVEIDTAGNCNK